MGAERGRAEGGPGIQAALNHGHQSDEGALVVGSEGGQLARGGVERGAEPLAQALEEEVSPPGLPLVEGDELEEDALERDVGRQALGGGGLLLGHEAGGRRRRGRGLCQGRESQAAIAVQG